MVERVLKGDNLYFYTRFLMNVFVLQHYLYELIINILVRNNCFYQLHQFLQYHVLADSKPLACLMLSLEHVYPPAHQLALDMLKVSQLCQNVFKLAEVQATEVKLDHISDVMVIMLTSSPVDHGSKLLSGQTKDHEIGIRCFIVKPGAWV